MAINIIKTGTMEYLTSEGISTPHCFTTRKGGDGLFHGLNLAHHRGDSAQTVEENYRRLAHALDFDLSKTVLTRQTHSDIIRPVTASDAQGTDHRAYPECDGLITCTAGVTLVVFTADCTPILLHDPVTGAVGAVHAGWRGTAADIAGKAVRAMQLHYGCEPKNIRAAIGPNIGPCCFQTHRDVPDAMIGTYGAAVQAWIRPQDDKFYVNLKEINAHSLRRAGVVSIDVDSHCTMCRPDLFWSHRADGDLRGSQGACICCEGRKM